jgi:hypothetical protein
MGALFILGVCRKKGTDFFRYLFSTREDDDEPGEKERSNLLLL